MRFLVSYEVAEGFRQQYVQLESGESVCRDNILVNFWHGTEYTPDEVEIVTIEKVEVVV